MDIRPHASCTERQETSRRNLPRRSRFYQSQMDAAFLEPGDDFSSLPESLVIFICTFDPFGRGRYRYTYRERCEKDGEPLGDGTAKVFLNTKGSKEDEIPKELLAFLSYVDDPQSSEGTVNGSICGTDPLVARLREKIRKIKRNPGMEGQYMLFGELLNDEREEGRREGLAEGHTRGLSEGLAQGHTRGFSEGLAQGFIDGQLLLLKLLRAMQKDGRMEGISRLETDPDFREEMYKKYEIR